MNGGGWFAALLLIGGLCACDRNRDLAKPAVAPLPASPPPVRPAPGLVYTGIDCGPACVDKLVMGEAGDTAAPLPTAGRRGAGASIPPPLSGAGLGPETAGARAGSDAEPITAEAPRLGIAPPEGSGPAPAASDNPFPGPHPLSSFASPTGTTLDGSPITLPSRAR